MSGTDRGQQNLIRRGDDNIAFVLPYAIGEVLSAKSGLMTEGSPHTDPSVSRVTNTKGVTLEPPPLPTAGEDKGKSTVVHGLFSRHKNTVLNGLSSRHEFLEVKP